MATAKSPDVRKRSPLRRLLRALIIFTAVPYLGILVLLALLQRSLIYGPTRDDTLNVRPVQISGDRIEPIRLTTAGDLTLNGWYITADVSEWTHGRPVILYFCGNAANRAYRAEAFEISGPGGEPG